MTFRISPELLSRFEPVAREQLKQVVTDRGSQLFTADSFKVEGRDPLVITFLYAPRRDATMLDPTPLPVEARGDKGQIKRVIVPLAVDDQGRRLVAWERQPEKLWRSQPASHTDNQAEKKLAILREVLEPMLQRELEYRGLATGSRGFEAKLIGWVEGIVS